MSSLIEKNGHQSMLLRVKTEQWPSSQATFKKPKQLKDPVPDSMVDQDQEGGYNYGGDGGYVRHDGRSSDEDDDDMVQQDDAGNTGSNSANSRGDVSHGKRLADSEEPRRRLTGSDDISEDDVPRRRLGTDDISEGDVPRRRLTASEGSSDGWTALGFAANDGIQSGSSVTDDEWTAMASGFPSEFAGGNEFPFSAKTKISSAQGGDGALPSSVKFYPSGLQKRFGEMSQFLDGTIMEHLIDTEEKAHVVKQHVQKWGRESEEVKQQAMHQWVDASKNTLDALANSHRAVEAQIKHQVSFAR